MIVHHLLSVTTLIAAIVLPAAAQLVDLNSSFGQVTGIRLDGVEAFLGIQYAQVGPRFSRSTLIETAPEEPVNATSYGPSCYQSLPPGAEETFAPFAAIPQEEECLYLNIWRPVNATPTSALTTMVFIHGGGYLVGTGSEPLYNGTNLAKEHGIVVVTINYRLGMFGFLVTGEDGYGGMNGVHDQINALTWVNNHIESFGGNPDNVTVFGASAGSIFVCNLSISPLAMGLFHRSIQQSGECAAGISVPNDAQRGEELASFMLNLTKATSVEDLTNATRFPAADITAYSASAYIGWPTVDGWVIPEQPSQLYSNTSNIVPSDMIIGSNSYDSAFLLSLTAEAFVAAADNMEIEIQGIFGPEYGSVVNAAYSPELYNGNQVAAYAQFWGDFLFRCGGRQFAAFVADNVAGKAFLYNYAHLSSIDPIVLNGLAELANVNDPTWATHAADLPMLFGTFNAFWGDVVAPTADDMEVSKEIMERWVSFAKSGDPNTADYDGWTPVPQGGNTPGTATTIPTFVLQKGGSQMVTVEEKAQQCSVFGFSSSPVQGTESPTPAANATSTTSPTEAADTDGNGATSSSIPPIHANILLLWIVIACMEMIQLFQ